MSALLGGEVWRSGPDERAMRIILAAIADNANDEGYAWPSIDTIADKCLYSRRTVLFWLKKLEIDGWLRINHHDDRDGTATRRGNSYNMILDKLEWSRPGTKRRKAPPNAKSAPIEASAIGAENDTGQVQKTTSIGAENGNPPHPLIGEPSLTIRESSSPSARKTQPERARKPSRISAWNAFRQDLKTYWVHKNGPLLPMPWDSHIDGKIVKRFLRQVLRDRADDPYVRPEDRAVWQQCLNNRGKSEVSFGDKLRYWVPDLLRYHEGPRDRFDKLIRSPTRKHEEQHDLHTANADVGERWLQKQQTGADGAAGALFDGGGRVLESTDLGRHDRLLVEPGGTLQPPCDGVGVRPLPPDVGVLPGPGDGDPVDREPDGAPREEVR